jgi:hypothetical protein
MNITDDQFFENMFNNDSHYNESLSLIKEAEKVEYRLVQGDNYEGISVREVYYDKENKVVGWGYMPLTALTSSSNQLVKELVHAMKHLDDMLAATKKPILDERGLRQQLYYRIHGKK